MCFPIFHEAVCFQKCHVVLTMSGISIKTQECRFIRVFWKEFFYMMQLKQWFIVFLMQLCRVRKLCKIFSCWFLSHYLYLQDCYRMCLVETQTSVAPGVALFIHYICHRLLWWYSGYTNFCYVCFFLHLIKMSTKPVFCCF